MKTRSTYYINALVTFFLFSSSDQASGADASKAVIGLVATGTAYGLYRAYATYQAERKIWQHPQVKELLRPDAPRKVVIFDMGGVLVDVHKTRLGLAQVGAGHFVTYMLTHLRSPEFVKRSVLTLYSSAAEGSCEITSDERAMKQLITEKLDGESAQCALPDLVKAFQAGLKNPDECIAFITQKSDILHAHGYYKSLEEKKILLSLATVPFQSESFAKQTSVIPLGVKLLQACKRAGHTVMILSNWDKHSFEYVERAYPEIFEQVKPEHRIISGTVNKLKPMASMYTHALDVIKRRPSECVFFDDQQENLDAAKKCGIEAVQFKLS